MKAYIQNKKTGLYLGPNGGWVEASSQAMAFPHSIQALDYGLEHQLLEESHIVLDFGNKEFEVTFDMGKNLKGLSSEQKGGAEI